MLRYSWPILLGLILAQPATTAESAAPSGGWKLVILENGEVPWLIAFENKDDKWSGKLLAAAEKAPEVKVEHVKVNGDQIGFDLTTRQAVFHFTGKIAKGSAPQVYGTLKRDGMAEPLLISLEATTAKSFADLDREAVAKAQPGDAKVFDLAFGLLSQASEKKAKPEEVRGWAEKAYKCAEPFGVEWQRDVALRICDTLLGQKDYAAAALENARRAERLTDAKDPSELQFRICKTVIRAMKAAGKDDDAVAYEAKLSKLEQQSEAEYTRKMMEFAPDAFKGRKAKSDRAVLVEFFTGSDCPPCVGVDLGFDALAKFFKPTEVVLLEYHEHVPVPDPLTSPASSARLDYYQEVERTPTVLFNGKVASESGAPLSGAKKKYEEFRAGIEPLLEKPAQAKLKATAARKGGKINIVAEVSELEKTGDDIRLRLVLVEERVKLTGSNGAHFYHHVVRAMPGGAKGIALTEKSMKQTATVDLEELRKTLNTALNTALEKNFEGKVTLPDRPMDFSKLSVVAFVQNDKTKEVLQALQVPVAEEK